MRNKYMHYKAIVVLVQCTVMSLKWLTNDAMF